MVKLTSRKRRQNATLDKNYILFLRGGLIASRISFAGRSSDQQFEAFLSTPGSEE